MLRGFFAGFGSAEAETGAHRHAADPYLMRMTSPLTACHKPEKLESTAATPAAAETTGYESMQQRLQQKEKKKKTRHAVARRFAR